MKEEEKQEGEEEFQSNRNHIQILDLVVASNSSSLKELERTMDRLIKKHKDFILQKQKFDLRRGYIN